MLETHYKKYTLKFNFPAGTSRGILHEKDSWFVFIHDEEGHTGIGECGLIKGLSPDDFPDYESRLAKICRDFNEKQDINPAKLTDLPSIRFGFEMALVDLGTKGNKAYKGIGEERILFPSEFTNGTDSIEINGLVWMGEVGFMKKQIREKLETGFTCIKLKISSINFEEELSLLKSIRKEYSAKTLELRVDANGAFSPDTALEKLKRLSEFELHSIEQPIKQGRPEKMAALCEQTPLPIALDEEMIGIYNSKDKIDLLNKIKPQYIIIKPSLVGGYTASEEWITLAEERNIGWWVTSALESSIGLNAIAQWTYTLQNKMPQGLGTGKIYSNNFESPLLISNGKLQYDPSISWDLSNLFN